MSKYQPTFKDYFMSLLVSSTRPVQAVMSAAGIAATISLSLATYNQTWTPFDQLADFTHILFVIFMFCLYCALSIHSALFNKLHQPYKLLKYAATIIGILLWTVAVSSSFHYTPEGFEMLHSMSFMYLIPLTADVWVLVQLLAGVEKIERRGSGTLWT